MGSESVQQVAFGEQDHVSTSSNTESTNVAKPSPLVALCILVACCMHAHQAVAAKLKNACMNALQAHLVIPQRLRLRSRQAAIREGSTFAWIRVGSQRPVQYLSQRSPQLTNAVGKGAGPQRRDIRQCCSDSCYSCYNI
jgi:hypothetical protein